MTDRVDPARIREILRRAGYAESALVEALKLEHPQDRIDVVAASRRIRDTTPLHVLIGLFTLGQAVAEEGLRSVLVPSEVDALIDSGLIVPSVRGFEATATIIPFEDFLVCSDFGPRFRPAGLHEDHVLGVGAASITLASLTVRKPVAAALDLGTGCGVQGLLAARHAGHVVATDVNPRALHFAAFNLRLNGITSIELRRGSLYDPALGDTFDLIVSNPPFVVSPDTRYTYRDSGFRGDAVSERVIRQAPARLNDGGYAVVLFNWYHPAESDWAERPMQWVEGSGCDAWLARFESSDPLTYAANWLRQTDGGDPGRYAELLDQWMAYYAELGVGAFSAGVMILRRRDGSPNWMRSDTIPSGRRFGTCGDQVERIFAAEDFLARLGEDSGLLEARFVLAPDHELHYQLRAENGGWTVQSAFLKQSHGFDFTGEVDRLVCGILARCDGQARLRDLAADAARQAGTELDVMVPACLTVVRRLLRSGYLEPVATH